ncbi:hypothetical protein GY45DRAFT_986165 [Cubamyces sp. BRFM 1775]|nr:hypothetical protein GY45DRAFT_986165 [Cubamyces sp. BRFM 1775]
MTEKLEQQPTPSPVHPAVVNPDVLDEVFQHLIPIRDHGELTRGVAGAISYIDSQQVRVKRKSLVNAAQVCKAFSEPASSVLWAAIVTDFGLFSTPSQRSR